MFYLCAARSPKLIFGTLEPINMEMHKLLKHQLADYYAAGQNPSVELLDLFEMVSRTYEFFEEKLIRLENIRLEQARQTDVLKAS